MNSIAISSAIYTLKDKSVMIFAKKVPQISMYLFNLQCRRIVFGLSITHFLKNQNASMCQI